MHSEIKLEGLNLIPIERLHVNEAQNLWENQRINQIGSPGGSPGSTYISDDTKS